MIDSLYANLDRAIGSDFLHRHGLTPGGYGVVTLHRPSNVDSPDQLARLLSALGEVAARVPLVLPVHPRTAARLGSVGVPDGLRLVPPTGYLDFIALQASARLVLTDSGGIQEETTYLGIPCFTLRANTERPVTLRLGTNTLLGLEPAGIDRILPALASAAPPPAEAPPLWDGHAAERVADVLEDALLDERLPIAV